MSCMLPSQESIEIVFKIPQVMASYVENIAVSKKFIRAKYYHIRYYTKNAFVIFEKVENL